MSEMSGSSLLMGNLVVSNEVAFTAAGTAHGLRRVWEFMQQYSVGAFATMFLLCGFLATQIVGDYATVHAENNASNAVQPSTPQTATDAKLNLAVPLSQLSAQEHTIENQHFSLSVGDQAVAVSAATITTWLQVSQDSAQQRAYLHINNAAVAASFAQIVKDHTKAAVNQVTADHNGVSSVIVPGTNGSAPADPAALVTQVSKTLLLAQGEDLKLPINTTPFAAVTPSAFSKLIEVNLVTKQMYLYDNGNLSYSYPISAGAPDTPTPVGEFHIFQKLPVQDMSGFNANGTKYFQPHVEWVNYFLPGGFAVHGNYWRPLSWFGNINSSHGCVSLPDNEAEQVYNWAPLGTTVITHD